MRIPLYSTLESRDGTLAADANLKNALVEVGEGDGTILVVKRPGLALGYEAVRGLAQGIADLNGVVYSVFNDVLVIPVSVTDIEYAGTVYPQGWSGPAFAFSGSESRYPFGDTYDSGHTYNPGDSAVFDGDTWYCVTSSTGVAPGYNGTAYSKWSKFPSKPSGSHPGITYNNSSQTLYQLYHGSEPFPYSTLATSTLTYTITDSAGTRTWGVLGGSFSATADGVTGYGSSLSTNYAPGGGILNGTTVVGSGGVTDNRTYIPYAVFSITYAASDYIRSHLF